MGAVPGLDDADGGRVSIGRLSHRVTLQQPDSTATSGFADVVSLFAQVDTVPASARGFDAGGPSAEGSIRIRLHYRSDVRSGWRVVEGDRTYQVSGYGDVDGRRRDLLLTCTEVQ